MKNLSLILASLFFSVGASFASPRQATQRPIASKDTKKTEKKAMTNKNNVKKENKKADTKAAATK